MNGKEKVKSEVVDNIHTDTHVNPDNATKRSSSITVKPSLIFHC